MRAVRSVGWAVCSVGILLSTSACCVLVVDGSGGPATSGGNPFHGSGGNPADSGPLVALARCRVVPVTASVGQQVTFDGNDSQPSAGAGAVVSWSWEFGDGTTADGPLASHTYGDAGLFIATLQVVDDAHVGAQATCPPVTVH